MNREIEFRGKRYGNGEWLYGHYYITGNGEHIIRNGIPCGIVDPETVGQYTGQEEEKDLRRPKDTVWRLYAGDVIEYHGNIGIIEWNDDAAGFVLSLIPTPKRTQPWIDFTCDIAFDCVKLGNRHDKPELLTTVDKDGIPK